MLQSSAGGGAGFGPGASPLGVDARSAAAAMPPTPASFGGGPRIPQRRPRAPPACVASTRPHRIFHESRIREVVEVLLAELLARAKFHEMLVHVGASQGKLGPPMEGVVSPNFIAEVAREAARATRVWRSTVVDFELLRDELSLELARHTSYVGRSDIRAASVCPSTDTPLRARRASGRSSHDEMPPKRGFKPVPGQQGLSGASSRALAEVGTPDLSPCPSLTASSHRFASLQASSRARRQCDPPARPRRDPRAVAYSPPPRDCAMRRSTRVPPPPPTSDPVGCPIRPPRSRRAPPRGSPPPARSSAPRARRPLATPPRRARRSHPFPPASPRVPRRPLPPLRPVVRRRESRLARREGGAAPPPNAKNEPPNLPPGVHRRRHGRRRRRHPRPELPRARRRRHPYQIIQRILSMVPEACLRDARAVCRARRDAVDDATFIPFAKMARDARGAHARRRVAVATWMNERGVTTPSGLIAPGWRVLALVAAVFRPAPSRLSRSRARPRLRNRARDGGGTRVGKDRFLTRTTTRARRSSRRPARV